MAMRLRQHCRQTIAPVSLLHLLVMASLSVSLSSVLAEGVDLGARNWINANQMK